MPDYLVTMSTRLAALLDRLTPARVKPIEDVSQEMELNREALRRAIEEWRTKGML